MDVASLDLWFRRGISVITLFFGIVQLYLSEKNIWIDAGFIICMAGIVGYYTNFLAIKMLFQPKQGKVLGWEGLVPKNKANIAKSLGQSIQTNLLAPEIILEYVYERKLIETGTQKVGEWLDELLKDQVFRDKVTEKIISLLQEKGPELLSQIFNFTEETLKDIARNPEEIKKVWEQIRFRINEYLQSRQNREYLVTQTRKIILEELPRLSVVLNNAIDEYLKQKDTIGNIGFGIKKIISFDNAALQDLLQKFIEDEDTTNQLMGVMDILVLDLQKKMEAQETQDYIITQVKDWFDVASEYSRKTFLPSAIERLKKYLDDPDNWDKVGNYSFKVLDYAKDKSLEFMQSQEGSEYLKTNIAKIIHQVNVTNLVEEQVMKLDTDELEKMILDNTGGNLVMIQFLGGVLGLIAGFIQVHIYFSVPVLGLVVLTWISYYRNQKKYNIQTK
ncbi:MAG TPA: DUF445 family protein [Leptospiraceae bacterium]|nr:DUF445 family protein [Leptospiraceae bacterium]HMW07329.1 DUF445 family protein [Leptospiraceae bacterium]HMX33397.1 DUF445 family protein [Leptospiraceae bacterium]HMY32963.1 DUF445 family protein [Leptospiraceae bacterium]HMZ64577.1 DUF445 family protein [Leptospiraceae bacterium]